MTVDSVENILREILRTGNYFGNLQINIQGPNIVQVNLNQSVKSGESVKVVEITNT